MITNYRVPTIPLLRGSCSVKVCLMLFTKKVSKSRFSRWKASGVRLQPYLWQSGRNGTNVYFYFALLARQNSFAFRESVVRSRHFEKNARARSRNGVHFAALCIRTERRAFLEPRRRWPPSQIPILASSFANHATQIIENSFFEPRERKKKQKSLKFP